MFSGSNDSRLHVHSAVKLESTHPSRTNIKSIMGSTEPLTTGPDFDPLLLLIALLAGDVTPNPGPPRDPCLVCFKNATSQGTSYLCTRCSHWVHSRCCGLRNVADYHRANGWIVHTSTMSDKAFNILQWNANGIGNKQSGLSIFLLYVVVVRLMSWFVSVGFPPRDS